MKKIVAITKVKNESDIIESLCRYAVEFCDAMLIYENDSIDNTREIIQKLIDEGLPIWFTDDIQDDVKKGKIIGGMGNLKYAMTKKAFDDYNADIVLNFDADEFLCTTEGRNPREALERLDETVEYRIKWRSYIYKNMPDDSETFLPNKFENYRNPKLEWLTKAIMSRYLYEVKKARPGVAYHFLTYPREGSNSGTIHERSDSIDQFFKFEVKNNAAVIEYPENLAYAHFPIRSKAQLMLKIIPSWINTLRYADHENDNGGAKIIYDYIKKYGDIDEEIVEKHSLEYMILPLGEAPRTFSEFTGDIVLNGRLHTEFCKGDLTLKYTDYIDAERTWVREALIGFESALTKLPEREANAVFLMRETRKQNVGLRQTLDSRNEMLKQRDEGIMQRDEEIRQLRNSITSKRDELVFNFSLPTVLYGAGRMAKQVFEQQLMSSSQCVCFVDADSSKWGKPAYDGCQLTVRSYEEAEVMYGDFNIYITVGPQLRYNVLAYLVDMKKTPMSRILNLGTCFRRKSCTFLETLILPFSEQNMGVCRKGRFTNWEKVSIVELKDDAGQSLDDLLKLRQRMLDAIQTTPDESPCTGCIALKEQVWPEKYRIRDYILFVDNISNSQSGGVPNSSNQSCNKDFGSEHFPGIWTGKRIDLLNEMEKRGLADPLFTTISFSDDEMRIEQKNHDNLFELAERYNTCIYTDALEYSNNIASLLERKKTTLIVSVNAGTQETYERVKGIDAFDKVSENLFRYSKIDNERTQLRYTYISGLNDKSEDIDGFIELCARLKTEHVSILADNTAYGAELEQGMVKGLFAFLDPLLRKGLKISVGGDFILSEIERRQILAIAHSIKDNIVRDVEYYNLLQRVLSEKPYHFIDHNKNDYVVRDGNYYDQLDRAQMEKIYYFIKDTM